MQQSQPDSLRELPPSAKLVYKVLEEEGRLTQKQLANHTLLPSRTVRSALDKIEGKDLLRERVNIRDARQSVYQLDVPASDA